MITDEDILAICIANVDDPQKAATEMVAKANVNGGEDNITVVVLGVRI
jgi:serine/threonine protein phosphatase PrpC